MPAAAKPWKSSCGRATQLKIWIGKTENLSIGCVGTNVKYTNALIAITGAASPIALDKAKIVPVSIPGTAEGSFEYQQKQQATTVRYLGLHEQ